MCVFVALYSSLLSLFWQTSLPVPLAHRKLNEQTVDALPPLPVYMCVRCRFFTPNLTEKHIHLWWRKKNSIFFFFSFCFCFCCCLEFSSFLSTTAMLNAGWWWCRTRFISSNISKKKKKEKKKKKKRSAPRTASVWKSTTRKYRRKKKKKDSRKETSLFSFLVLSVFPEMFSSHHAFSLNLDGDKREEASSSSPFSSPSRRSSSSASSSLDVQRISLG